MQVACAGKGDVVQQLHARGSLADAQVQNKRLSAAAEGYRQASSIIDSHTLHITRHTLPQRRITHDCPCT